MQARIDNQETTQSTRKLQESLLSSGRKISVEDALEGRKSNEFAGSRDTQIPVL